MEKNKCSQNHIDIINKLFEIQTLLKKESSLKVLCKY